jgi:hypothetical protein
MTTGNATVMYKRYFLCLILVTALPALCAPSQSPAPSEDGVVIMQKSDSIGEQEVTATKHALKMVNKKDGITLIAKSPDWDIILYNPKSRTYFQTKSATWHGRMPIGDLMEREPNLFARDGKPEVMNGLKVMHRIIDEKSPHHAQRGADYWYIKELSLPQTLCDIVQRDYAMPPVDGFPLSYIHIGGGERQISLQTIKLQRQKIPASTFAVPPQMKHVNGTQLVIYSGDKTRNGFVQDMVDGMSK